MFREETAERTQPVEWPFVEVWDSEPSQSMRSCGRGHVSLGLAFTVNVGSAPPEALLSKAERYAF